MFMSSRRTPPKDVELKVAELRSDFPKYAETNLKITDKDGQLVPLILNRMQRVLWLIILELIRLRKPVRIYLIKARQLGSTTFFSAVLYWLITLNRNKSVIGIAQDDEAAENVNLRWQNYFWNSREELRPKFRKMNPSMIHFASPLKDMKAGEGIGLDSKMVVKTANAPNLARSFTHNGALLTEFCLWPGLGIDVKKRMVALKQAVPKRPNTCIFIESTAQGDNYGKKFWDNKRNGYVKVFVSWLAEDEYRIYFKPGLKNYFELAEDDDDVYGNEVKERRNIIKQLKIWYPVRMWNGGNNDFPDSAVFETYDGWLNHESYCRLLWRRGMIDDECEGDKDEFRREYPTTVADAFGVSSKSVFGSIKLLEVKEFVRTAGIRAKRFSYRHPANIRKSTLRDCIFPFKKGRLRIYELPKAGASYVCGADAAQGNEGGDDSSFVMFRLSPETGKLVEVASFNDSIEATEFAGMLYFICRFYNRALLGVERNDKGGFACLEILRKELKYNRLYWYKNPLGSKKPSEVQWGWITNEMSRQIMIKDGKTWFRRNILDIRSMEILEQMDTFAENQKTGKVEATTGNHDDLVMAMLIAAQLSKQIHIKEHNVSEEIPANSLALITRLLDKRSLSNRRVPGGSRKAFEKRSGARRKLKLAA